MSAPYEHIESHESVLQAFGYWPSFHDAEIRSLLLDRNTILFDDIANARLDLCVHALEWTRDAAPVFNHHLVCFRFHDLSEVVLKDFNHQNAILEMKIEDHIPKGDGPSLLRVTIVQAFGLAGSFSASQAQVLSVVPCDSEGRPKKDAEPIAGRNRSPAAGSR